MYMWACRKNPNCAESSVLNFGENTAETYNSDQMEVKQSVVV